jgi:fructoselysine-6-P-deglycase FrlB-like protein
VSAHHGTNLTANLLSELCSSSGATKAVIAAVDEAKNGVARKALVRRDAGLKDFASKILPVQGASSDTFLQFVSSYAKQHSVARNDDND